MHEFSIATQILESVLEFANSHQPCDVLEIRLEIGELTGIEPDQLKFCFDSIKVRSPLKDSSLLISSVPARIRCEHCPYEGPPTYWVGALVAAGVPTLQCPKCGQTARSILGHDCAIRTVQLREPAGQPGQKDDLPHECDPDTSAVPSLP